MPLLNATLVPAPDQVVVRLTGDADLSTAPFVADVLTQAGSLGTRQVVVDLGSARFWDCSGLHALARFTRELTVAGRACRIVGAQRETRRLIGMANLAGDLQLDGLPTAPARRVTSTGRTPLREPVAVADGLVAAGHR
ncbi:anti-anti-sigma factor [Blastococcus colisei]|uniref:Anti-anti-sigma factor n=1 Tax=Blastococcus colisei TaxID=1564162 RepID=A0A543PJF3_9ACTN|nr:anti-anti-sigma factor [Blastococcus colisei]